MRADDLPAETDRTLPSMTRRECLTSSMEDLLDDLAALLQEEIDYQRSKSDPPSDGDRVTLPSVH